jgi:hypothetical protein
MKALIEAGDLRLVDEDVLLAYWFNEYEIGIKLNGHGRQGHGSIVYVDCHTRPHSCTHSNALLEQSKHTS